MSNAQSTKSALHQTEEQFHILVDSVEEYAIYMLDAVGNVVTWNAGAQKIKQYTANEIIGKNFACFYAPFEQGDPSITREFGGLGLGLAISKYLVDLHQGSVKVQSRGRSFGATFKVTLDAMPVCGEKMQMGLRGEQNLTRSLRILLVEDHSDTLQALSRLLAHFGHEVSTANRAEAALNIINSKEFDVVLSDIGLPDGNGYDLISEAKRRRPITAVALTGFGTEEDLRRSKEAGFDFHLVKPIDFHELRTVLNQVAA